MIRELIEMIAESAVKALGAGVIAALILGAAVGAILTLLIT